MSSEQASNSIYGIDSVGEFSESPIIETLITKESDALYSSGSSIELSGIQSEAEASNSVEEINQDQIAKTDSIKSLWSTPEGSHPHKYDDYEYEFKDEDDLHNCNCNHGDCKREHILPSNVSPFVDDGHVVRYNVERGVDYHTPFIIGSRKLVGKDNECGYHPSHLVFDPKSGTLAVGYDVSNGWAKLPNFSLITGLGNSAELDASFISGSHNKIKLEMRLRSPTDVTASKKDEYCLLPPSCAIIGGTHNSITNTSHGHYSAAIIASSGIEVEDCEETVILGMKLLHGQEPFKGHKESTFARNLYGLGKVHAGPLSSDSDDEVLYVNGDAFINGNLGVTGNINAHSASFNTINANNITQTNQYFEGISGSTGVDFSLSEGDGINVIYANPVGGDIRIELGPTAGYTFESNRSITIKDVTLEFAQGSSYNVYICVPTGVRIEHYGTGIFNSTMDPALTQSLDLKAGGTGGMYGLTASENGTYVLNTSGGSVTFQYVSPLIVGALPTWVIQSQLVGNPRLLQSTGITFIAATNNARARLLRRN